MARKKVLRDGAEAPPQDEGEGAADAPSPPTPLPPSAGEGSGAEESDGLKMAETLRGDIRDRLLAVIRGMPRPWDELDESGQEIIAETCSFLAERMIYRVIEIVHAEGAPSLRMNVDGVAFKKGMKAQLSGSRADPFRHLLADATDTDVLVVLENAMRFMGETAPPAIEKDAPELPLGDRDEKPAKAKSAARRPVTGKSKAAKDVGGGRGEESGPDHRRREDFRGDA